MTKNSGHYALITGSSTGIGRAMAEECARHGINLLLVALDEPVLYETGAELRRRHEIDVHCLGIDLAEEAAARLVFDWVQAGGYPVYILINNAGYGRSGLLETHALEEYHRMVQLNNRAAIGLTHVFLPLLKAQPKAYLLYTSSMEATLPLPYKAVYTGTKHFLYGFSLALREELREFGVSVSVLCPGPVATNEDAARRLRSQGWKGKLIAFTPEEVGTIAIRGMLRGRQVIIPGFLPRFIVKVMNWFPEGLKMKIMAGIFQGYKELPPP